MNSDYSTSRKLITAILPKGKGSELIEKLVHELGIQTVNVNYARGLGRITPLRHRGLGETTEKSIVTVLVDEDRADEIFEYIFYEADINRPHGGLMFQQPLLASTNYMLPDLEEEQ